MTDALHKLAEHIVIYAVETNTVKSAVKNQVAAVEKNVLDIGEHTLHLGNLTLTFPTLFTEQIQTGMAASLLTSYPLLAFGHEAANL